MKKIIFDKLRIIKAIRGHDEYYTGVVAKSIEPIFFDTIFQLEILSLRQEI